MIHRPSAHSPPSSPPPPPPRAHTHASNATPLQIGQSSLLPCNLPPNLPSRCGVGTSWGTAHSRTQMHTYIQWHEGTHAADIPSHLHRRPPPSAPNPPLPLVPARACPGHRRRMPTAGQLFMALSGLAHDLNLPHVLPRLARPDRSSSSCAARAIISRAVLHQSPLAARPVAPSSQRGSVGPAAKDWEHLGPTAKGPSPGSIPALPCIGRPTATAAATATATARAAPPHPRRGPLGPCTPSLCAAAAVRFHSYGSWPSGAPHQQPPPQQRPVAAAAAAPAGLRTPMADDAPAGSPRAAAAADAASPPGTRPAVCDTVVLTPQEQALFDTLLAAAAHTGSGTVLRCAGGWVRDKLLGRDSDDIDIALDNKLGKARVSSAGGGGGGRALLGSLRAHVGPSACILQQTHTHARAHERPCHYRARRTHVCMQRRLRRGAGGRHASTTHCSWRTPGGPIGCCRTPLHDHQMTALELVLVLP